MSLNRKLGLVFAGTVLSRLLFHYLTGFTADDAFITYRYAENIAAGLGFVYNDGQRVLGSTTPLFTLILSLFSVCRIAAPVASLMISVLCSGLTGLLLYRFALSLRFTRWTLLPVVCYALWPRSLVTDTSGMETAFFTLLVTAAFYFQHKQLDIYAVGMATLATVTRPEGALVLGLLVIYNCFRSPRQIAKYLAIPVIILGPWLIFAQFYFGSVIPNSALGKLALYSRWGTMPLWDTIVYLMAWHNPFGWVMTIGAIGGAYWLDRKQNFGRLEVIWLLAMFLFYITSGSRIFFWYIVPIYPVYILVACACLPLLADYFKFRAARLDRWRWFVIGAVAIVLMAVGYRSVQYYRPLQVAFITMHKSIGEYLLVHAGPNDLVAAEDIGYMGYYSGCRILDRDGLISPQAIPFNRSGDYFGLIKKYNPDWVVASTDNPMSQFITDSLFLSMYENRSSYAFAASQYNIYARRK